MYLESILSLTSYIYYIIYIILTSITSSNYNQVLVNVVSKLTSTCVLTQ